MAQSILVFDFGTNEDAAQQARLKLEGWTQAFRLGKKILLKFDRERSAEDGGRDGDAASGEGAAGEGKSAKGKAAQKKSPAKAAAKQAESKGAPSKDKKDPAASAVRLLVRLDFSGHEKLSHHRWLARIPSEEPFKSAMSEIILHTDPGFPSVTERFDLLA
jgi:hypothetical protein